MLWERAHRHLLVLNTTVAITAALTIAGAGTTDANRPSCMRAKIRCIGRTGCGLALQNVLVACISSRSDGITQCTERCKNSLVSLLSVEDGIGRDYLRCDCAGNEHCELFKNKVSLCADDVLGTLAQLDNYEYSVRCSLAWMLCESDTSCYTALTYYERHCRQMWWPATDEHKCTRKCNNSLSILYRQAKANALKTCLCDDSDPKLERAACERMRYNTEKYCLLRDPKLPHEINFPAAWTAALRTTTSSRRAGGSIVEAPLDNRSRGAAPGFTTRQLMLNYSALVGLVFIWKWASL